MENNLISVLTVEGVYHDGLEAHDAQHGALRLYFFFFFLIFTLVASPRRPLSLKLSDTRVYEPQIRAHLGTTAHFCRVVVLKLKAVPNWYHDGLETHDAQHGAVRLYFFLFFCITLKPRVE